MHLTKIKAIFLLRLRDLFAVLTIKQLERLVDNLSKHADIYHCGGYVDQYSDGKVKGCPAVLASVIYEPSKLLKLKGAYSRFKNYVKIFHKFCTVTNWDTNGSVDGTLKHFNQSEILSVAKQVLKNKIKKKVSK